MEAFGDEMTWPTFTATHNQNGDSNPFNLAQGGWYNMTVTNSLLATEVRKGGKEGSSKDP